MQSARDHRRLPAGEDDIDVRATDSTDRRQIIRLYKAAGWWSPENDRNPEFVDHIARSSYYFVGAYRADEMIGMGRVLSDGISDAYIQDVTVLPDYRQRGIGGRIITALLDKLRTDRIEWIGLVGEPGTGNFYQRLGFTEMKGSVPFTFKG
jgi:spermidine synthase